MFFPGYGMNTNRGPDLSPFIEKFVKGELTLEDILEEDSIIQDLKSNQDSQFLKFFTDEKIKKLIDYSTKIPISEEKNIGYKYPFNATEILSSQNFHNILMRENIEEQKAASYHPTKGGFITTIAKVIFKYENENNPDFEKDYEEFEISTDTESTEVKMCYENIDYLLGFLNESKETKENYVLVGYFSKIMNNLFEYNNTTNIQFVNYLFDYPKKDEFDALCCMIKNMNMKSMCDIMKKLLLLDITEIKMPLDDINHKKIYLFEAILNELNDTNESNKFNFISECLTTVMNDKKFFNLFLSKPKLIEKLYDIVNNSKQNTEKLSSLLKLITKINDITIQNFETRVTPFDQQELNNEYMEQEIYYDRGTEDSNNIEELKNFLNNYFDVLEKNGFSFMEDFGNCAQKENSEFMTTYLKPQKRIGIKKIIQTQYILTILDVLLNAYSADYSKEKIEKIINIINEQNIFWNLHNLLFLFPFSNIYQIYYIRILDIVLIENAPKCLVEKYLIEKNTQQYLTDIYIEKINQNIKFIFTQTQSQTLNPNVICLISCLNKIVNCTNQHIKEITSQSKNLSVFYDIMGKEVNEIFSEKFLQNDMAGINFGNIEEENVDLNYFGSKSFIELIDEDLEIYELYKKGEDYQTPLKQKQERIQKEKEERKVNKKSIIDTFSEEENTSFKFEKNSLTEEKDNFLAMLNKQTEELNKDEENIYINNDKNDIKELEYNENEINNINKENQIENDDATPNLIYNKNYNQIFEEKKEDKKEEEKKEEKNDDNHGLIDV